MCQPTVHPPRYVYLQVSSGHLHRVCNGCGGALRCSLLAADFSARLTVFRNVARHQAFELLLQTVEWLMSQQGH